MEIWLIFKMIKPYLTYLNILDGPVRCLQCNNSDYLVIRTIITLIVSKEVLWNVDKWPKCIDFVYNPFRIAPRNTFFRVIFGEMNSSEMVLSY